MGHLVVTGGNGRRQSDESLDVVAQQALYAVLVMPVSTAVGTGIGLPPLGEITRRRQPAADSMPPEEEESHARPMGRGTSPALQLNRSRAGKGGSATSGERTL